MSRSFSPRPFQDWSQDFSDCGILLYPHKVGDEEKSFEIVKQRWTMNKREVLVKLAAIANKLDAKGAHSSASALTDVMRRVSQANPWWQNESGEPMYSPEAIRAEESADSRYDGDRHDDDYSYQDDGRAEEQSERFQGVFDNWASSQEDLSVLQQKVNGDLRDMLEQYILETPNSNHQTTWWNDPDTMHDVLDAAKIAILNDTDIMQAINSVPAEGQQGYQYEGPEDFGWDGGRED